VLMILPVAHGDVALFDRRTGTHVHGGMLGARCDDAGACSSAVLGSCVGVHSNA